MWMAAFAAATLCKPLAAQSPRRYRGQCLAVVEMDFTLSRCFHERRYREPGEDTFSEGITTLIHPVRRAQDENRREDVAFYKGTATPSLGLCQALNGTFQQCVSISEAEAAKFIVSHRQRRRACEAKNIQRTSDFGADAESSYRCEDVKDDFLRRDVVVLLQQHRGAEKPQHHPTARVRGRIT